MMALHDDGSDVALAAFTHFAQHNRKIVQEQLGSDAPFTAVAAKLTEQYKALSADKIASWNKYASTAETTTHTDAKAAPATDAQESPAPTKTKKSKKRKSKEEDAPVQASPTKKVDVSVKEAIEAEENSPEQKKKKANKNKPKEDATDKEKKAHRKKRKDPNAPKRGMSAYLYFTSENREKIKKEKPDIDFAEMAKLLGAEWKTVGDIDKAKFEKLAAEDKARYAREKNAHNKEMKESENEESGAEAEGGSEVEEPALGVLKKKKRKKKKKDPNAPKGVTSSFFYYLKANRDRLQAENTDLKAADINKIGGAEYKALTDKDKAKWVKMFETDRARHAREIEQYTAGNGKVAEENDSDSEGTTEV